MRPGYKQTEVGLIPEDWETKPLGALCSMKSGMGITGASIDEFSPFPVFGGNGRRGFTKEFTHDGTFALFGRQGALCGNVYGVSGRFFASEHAVVVTAQSRVSVDWLTLVLTRMELNRYSESSAQPGLAVKKIMQLMVATPKKEREQRAIAAALGDVDAAVAGLERLIAKKRDLKQAAMQQLLTGQTRLPGFTGEWEVKRLEDAVDCMDNLRVPLNDRDRATRKGTIPYCGANGVVDYVDDFVVDDDIILMAEDGGYFDEYRTRPIAYRMVGKAWVNNHAHILKAKCGIDQGFMFFSLVHKNIQSFLASGTRAKLNKSEMNKIEVQMPKDEAEQTAIATVLSDIDAELAALQAQLDKTSLIKQAMMQDLLTGRVRLPYQ